MVSKSWRYLFRICLCLAGLITLAIWLSSCNQTTIVSSPGYSRIDPGGNYAYADPAWSPDSLRIAYVRYERLSPSEPPDHTSEIFIMNTNGGQAVQLTHNDLLDSAPAWAPNGQQLVYVREYTGYDVQANQRLVTDTLRVINVDGSEDKQIYACEFQCGAPSWSPDGKQIAFYAMSAQWAVGSTNEPPSDIYLITVDGTDLVRLTQGSHHALWPEWSPANQRIAYSDNRDSEIRVVDVQSAAEVVYSLGDLRSESFHPTWSPDGSSLLFSGMVPGTGYWQQYYLNLGTGKIDLFFTSGEQNPSSAMQVDRSSDGNKLVFIIGDSQIYLADLSILKHR